MKSLIFAIALSLSTPALAVPAHTTPQHIKILPLHALSDESRKATAGICLGLIAGKIEMQEVVDNLHLDTQAKQQSMVNTCMIYAQGVEDGLAIASQAEQQNEQGEHPNINNVAKYER